MSAYFYVIHFLSSRAIISIISRPFDAGRLSFSSPNRRRSSDPLVRFGGIFFSHARLSFASELRITRSKFFTRSRPSPKIEINFTQCVRVAASLFKYREAISYLLGISSSFSSLFSPTLPRFFFLLFVEAHSLLISASSQSNTGLYTCIYIYLFLLGITTFKS